MEGVFMHRSSLRTPARATLFLAFLFASFPSALVAELPPLIPRDDLFGNPEKTSPRLSPDGQRLAWLAPDKKNVLQVWVKTIGKDDEKMVTADKKRGIRTYSWAANSTTLLYRQDNAGDENFHNYGKDLFSGNVRDFTPYQKVRANLSPVKKNFPDENLVEINLLNLEQFDDH